MANINGTAGNDSLEGTPGDDFIAGLEGDDTIFGYGGSDVIQGGLGDDSLVGGDDGRWDTVDYQMAGGSVTVNLATGLATGADGNDTLVGFERVTGSGFDDTLVGSAGGNDFEGRAGNDSIVGGGGYDKAYYWVTDGTAGVHVDLANQRAYDDGWGGVDTLVGISQIVSSLYNDSLAGDGGENTFTPFTGNDTIDGRGGLDTVDYSFSASAVNVNLATHQVTGKSYVMDGTTLRGTDQLTSIELVRGSDHNDILTGSTNDWFESFEGGKGNDTIDGGAITTANNSNRASYQNASDSVTVDLGANANYGTATGADGSDRLYNINHVRGSAFNDNLYGTNAAAYTEIFDGRGGNDSIDGRGGIDIVRYDSATTGVNVALAGLDGGAKGGASDGLGGFDTLVGIEGVWGSNHNDTLIGGHVQGGVILEDGLIEFFRGGAGNDTIDGGQGYDRADYDSSTSGVYVDLGAHTAQDGLGGTDTLYNIEGVRGSSHNDTLIGSDAYFESFEGGAGNDSIVGNGGWDRVDYRYAGEAVNVNLADGRAYDDGQSGTDTLEGIEWVRGSNFNDTIAGDANDNKLEGMGGNDSIAGGDGNDTIEGGNGDDSIDGGNGNDHLQGGVGNDTINGGDGDDYILGGVGNDVLNGGSGWNWAAYWDATAGVTVNLLTGRATGGGGSDTLSGFQAAAGSNFNDTLIGDANNNDFNGGAGNDRIEGGGGKDRVGYWGVQAGVSVNLATGQAKALNVANAGLVGTDTLINISGAVGTDFADSLVGNAGDNDFEGWGGNDTIDGGAGNDWMQYGIANASVQVNLADGKAYDDGQGGEDTLINIENVGGTHQADTLVGSSVANMLVGNGGDDSIDGLGGDDQLYGGAGSDTILGGDGNDGLYGEDGDDSLEGGAGNDQLNGGAGNDTLMGGAGSDFLTGGAGDDFIDGGAVTDRPGYTDGNTLSYQFDTAGIVMDLSGITGDGSAGHGTVTDGWGGTDTVVNVPFIRGSNFGDSILGSTADIFEMFEGLGGNDTIDGGAMTVVDGVVTNSNRVSYQNAGAAVTVDLQAGTAIGGAGSDTLSNFNQVRGSAYNDSLAGTDADHVELFEGLGGNDTIDGRGGFDIVRYDLANVSTGVNVDLSAGTATDGMDTNATLAGVQAGTDSLIGIEGVYGTGYADTLAGDAENNRLEGRGGNDSINGGAGNDTLLGGAGDDTLDGGTGTDLLDGGDGNDTANFSAALGDYTITRISESDLQLAYDGSTTTVRNVENLRFSDGTRTLASILNTTGSEFGDTLTGTAGTDVIHGYDGNDSISGLAGNDTLYGDDGNDTLNGGQGDDSLYGGAGDDTLLGDAGNDLLDGGEGLDRMEGGAGNDTYVVDSEGDTIVETATGGIDTVNVAMAGGTYTLLANVENAAVVSAGAVHLTGNTAANVLTGNDEANILIGGAGNDTLAGGGGNDTLDGGAGVDSMSGGAGDDLYVIDAATDKVVELSGEGADTVQVAFAAAGLYTLAENVENAVITAANALAITLKGNAGDNVLTGNAGNNVFDGGLGNDTIHGGGGKDTIDGGQGEDRVVVQGPRSEYTITRTGTGANEVMLLTRGTDVVSIKNVEFVQFEDTVEGYDALFAKSTSDNADSITGTEGNDEFDGKGGNDVINGLGGNDLLKGGAGNDVLVGGAGNDTLDGGTGTDNLVGGAGDDTYVVDAAGDVVEELENEGTDLVQVAMSSGTYELRANVENATVTHATGGVGLTGNELDNHLIGNGGANTLKGNAGDDHLEGMAGNDVLEGGDGNDTLDGGAGVDKLTGGAGNDRLITGGGNDTVDGGEGTDTLVLAGNEADWTLERTSTATQFKRIGSTETVTFSNVENVQFSDNLVDVQAVLDRWGTSFADTLRGNSGDDDLNGQGGNDTIYGYEGNDTLTGGAGDDRLHGGDGNDQLSGDAGNDFLDGGEGSDTLTGGAGNDTYLVDEAGDVVVEALNGGTDTVRLALESGAYTLTDHVENATVDALAGAVSVTGNGLNNVLTGNGLNNLLNGDAGNDTLNGGAGNDTLIGGAGLDKLFGGEGDDTYEVDLAGDTVTEALNQGTDTVQVNYAAAGTHTLAANVENGIIISDLGLKVNLTGNTLANRLEGNAGDNVLMGGAGSDTLVGGGGNDTLDGGAGAADTNWAMFDADFDDYLVVRPSNTDVRLTHIASGDVTIVRNVQMFDFNGVQMTLAEVKENTAGIGNETIVGTSGADLIDGLAGNDSLSGLGDNDTLVGGLGNDTLDGGTGNDRMEGGAGNDTYVVDAVGDVVVEALNGGTDTVEVALASGTYDLHANVENATVTSSGAVNLVGNGLNNVLKGNAEANRLEGDLGNDTLDGGAGNDTLLGGDGADSLVGGAGNDSLNGGAGADKLVGGDGDDTYEVDVAGDTITEAVNQGTDTVRVNFAAAGTYTLAANVENGVIVTSNASLKVNLTGNTLANELEGNAGDNVLMGGAGSDTLIGGGGNDTLDGGAGAADTDVAVFQGDRSRYVVAQISQTDLRLTDTLTSSIVIVRNVETFSFDDGDLGLAALKSGIATIGPDTLTGGIEDDDLDGLAGNDVISGMGGNDLLKGGAGNDTLYGGEGDDTLDGGAGVDEMNGGAGNDTYVVDVATDKVVEAASAGTDLVQVAMASGTYGLTANVENATVTHLTGAVSLTGNELDNVLTGNGGINTLRGGAGNDTLKGEGGNDSLFGDDGDDVLEGGIGNDKLDGGVGDDTLVGGVGKDTLTGGAGADVFVFDTNPISTANADSITDFNASQGDKIHLSAAVFSALGDAGDPVEFGEYLSYNTGTGALVYDADGVGGATGITVVTLVGRPALTEADLVLIA